MKKYIILFLVLSSLQLGFSQTRNEKINEKIEAQRIAFITKQLDLTVEESQSFWPVYNEYEARMKSTKERYKNEVRIENMSEEQAKAAIVRSFELQALELDLKKELNNQLQGVIPATKIVKIPLAERKFKQKLLERIKERRKERRTRR